MSEEERVMELAAWVRGAQRNGYRVIIEPSGDVRTEPPLPTPTDRDHTKENRNTMESTQESFAILDEEDFRDLLEDYARAWSHFGETPEDAPEFDAVAEAHNAALKDVGRYAETFYGLRR